VIAWRTHEAPRDATEALRSAIKTVLARS